MSHRRAVWLMIATALMWSISGVVTRHLDGAGGFEIAFWRSAFTALALVPMLAWLRGPRVLWRALRDSGVALWVSGTCWAVMFTAFMLALTLTTVANVLVTLALAPLLTALLARIVIGHRLALRTWLAILIAGAGIAWMYGGELATAAPRHLLGVLVAFSVPLAAAVNWTLLQHMARRQLETPTDMLPAVLLGALLASAVCLPLAWPFAATAHDIGLLAMLGTLQLALPCVLSVVIARVLSAPEISLYALLEVLFGIAWVWLFAGEVPSGAVLGGGSLVLGALVMNEALALRAQPTAVLDALAARRVAARPGEP